MHDMSCKTVNVDEKEINVDNLLEYVFEMWLSIVDDILPEEAF